MVHPGGEMFIQGIRWFAQGMGWLVLDGRSFIQCRRSKLGPPRVGDGHHSREMVPPWYEMVHWCC